LEDEIVQLKGKLEKKIFSLNLKKYKKILNNSLSSESSSGDKTGQGYDPSTEQENEKISYGDVLKKPINKKEKKKKQEQYHLKRSQINKNLHLILMKKITRRIE
jgi:hypothetical protein